MAKDKQTTDTPALADTAPPELKALAAQLVACLIEALEAQKAGAASLPTTPAMPTEAQAHGDEDEVLEITARSVRGYRRAGRNWTDTPTIVPASDFTVSEIAALESTPELIVVRKPKPTGQAPEAVQA